MQILYDRRDARMVGIIDSSQLLIGLAIAVNAQPVQFRFGIDQFNEPGPREGIPD